MNRRTQLIGTSLLAGWLALGAVASPSYAQTRSRSSVPPAPAPAPAPAAGAPAEKDPALAAAEDAVRQRQYEKAVSIWRTAAERGNPHAAYQIGVAHRNGRGVQKDLAQAAAWFERAANAGDPDAQFALGLLYRSGIGVERNPERALELLTRAARVGHRQAQSAIARIRHGGSIAYSAADPRVAVHAENANAALAQAIRVGDLNAAREALARGAAANGGADAAATETPLASAIELGRVEIVRLLLRSRAGADRPSQAGEPPLVLAVRRREPQIVRALLEAGAGANIRARNGSSVLAEAARAGRLEVVESLIAAGADPRATAEDGTSAADLARRMGHDAVAQRLRQLGAPRASASSAIAVPAAPMPNGLGAESGALPPIIEAARRGDARLLRSLLGSSARAVSIQDAMGNTALHRAADGSHLACVRALLDAGADPNAKARDGSTPLLRAMASTAKDADAVFALLLDRGGDPTIRDARGDGLLARAANGATPAKLDRLVASGATIDDAELEKALARAVVVGAKAPIFALSQRVKTPTGRLPALCAAIVGERDEIVADLLGAGSALDGDCGGGRSPLLVAIHAGRTDRVHLLLEAGASPSYAAPGTDPPLIAAASRGLTPTLSLLLARGAEIDRRGAHRTTALMGAAANGRIDAVRALLEAGADPKMRSETDQTAVDLAEAAGHGAVVELLRKRRSGLRGLLGSD